MSTETYRQRLRQYKRRESLTIWVGAGLAGFIALLAGDVLGNILTSVPSWLSALLVTSIVFGGAALGFARVKFEWAATSIQRGVAEKSINLKDAMPAEERWPKSAEICWTASLCSLVVAGALMIMSLWWRDLMQVSSYLGEVALSDRDSSVMKAGVFAAPDLHRLMFGLLYPAVLGALFFSLLPQFSRTLSRKRTGGAEYASPIKIMAGFLIVLHFVVDFQLTSSMPAKGYSLLGFIVDLLILFGLFLAFDALNVGRPDQPEVRRSAVAVAGTYALFLIWSLVTLEVTLEHWPLWVAELTGLALFIIVAAKRNVIFLCLSLAIMSMVMGWVGSLIVGALREIAAAGVT